MSIAYPKVIVHKITVTRILANSPSKSVLTQVLNIISSNDSRVSDKMKLYVIAMEEGKTNEVTHTQRKLRLNCFIYQFHGQNYRSSKWLELKQ